ncbi:MAG: hypothetical protein HY831_03565 [Candidatus Aenigmarchaeota archaeon]|nr:hypothetical protein [Candidatus Aenigmarchaeota archaeon]
MPVTQVYKRDGKIVEFDRNRIKEDIYQLMLSLNEVNMDFLEKLTDSVVILIDKKDRVVKIDEIQDSIENILMEEKLYKMTKTYIVRRIDKSKTRSAKVKSDIFDEYDLTLDSVDILKNGYLSRDHTGKIIETTMQMFRRVARNIAQAEYLYGKQEEDVIELEERFFEMLSNQEFAPNPPTLINAGKDSQQLIGFFVLPVEDSVESIFDCLKQTIMINQFGGLVGISFSRLRPRGSQVTSGHKASGPLSFMKLFDAVLNDVDRFVIEKNNFVLRIDHPDILDFISDDCNYKNFNLYVAVTEKFVKAVMDNEEYSLINPLTDDIVGRLNARNVFDLLSTAIWRTSSINILFIDKINRENPTNSLGYVEALSLQPLMPYESVAAGVINLSKFIKNSNVDWERLRKVVRLGINFLDNIIEMSRYPSQEIEMMTKGNRKISLGIIGLSELLVKINVPYESDEALKISEDLIRFINEESRFKSQMLANERDVYDNYEYSEHKKTGMKIRNSSRMSIYPSSTLSTILNSTNGIEPISVSNNEVLNNLFELKCRENNIDLESIKKEVIENNSVKNIGIPSSLKRLFSTNKDITIENQINVQSIFEKYCDGIVNKQIVVPSNLGIKEIENIFLKSYETGFRSINIKIDKNFSNVEKKKELKPLEADCTA